MIFVCDLTNIVLSRLDNEMVRLTKNYKKRKVLHDGFNSGDLRRLQALVYIKTGLRKSLKELHEEIHETR
jgi:hypothetical protein